MPGFLPYGAVPHLARLKSVWDQSSLVKKHKSKRRWRSQRIWRRRRRRRKRKVHREKEDEEEQQKSRGALPQPASATIKLMRKR